MASYVQRTRQVIAAEDDDFFRADTILYYLNKSKRKVVSYMTQQEIRPTIQTQEGVIRGAERSLRALDGLRGIATETLGSFTQNGQRFEGNAPFPNDLLQILYLRYDGNIILRELNSQKLYELEWGNLVPTVYEGYYYVTDNNGKSFQLYLHENPSTNDLTIFYIKEPTDIEMEDETMSDLPEQVENAIIYGAALMMVGQESVKDPQGNTQMLSEIYSMELQNSLF